MAWAAGKRHEARGTSGGTPLVLPCASPLVTASRGGAGSRQDRFPGMLNHPGLRGALARGLVCLAAGLAIAAVFPRCVGGAYAGTGHPPDGALGIDENNKTPRKAGEAVASRDRLPAVFFAGEAREGTGGRGGGTDTNGARDGGPPSARVIAGARGRGRRKTT